MRTSVQRPTVRHVMGDAAVRDRWLASCSQGAPCFIDRINKQKKRVRQCERSTLAVYVVTTTSPKSLTGISLKLEPLVAYDNGGKKQIEVARQVTGSIMGLG